MPALMLPPVPSHSCSFDATSCRKGSEAQGPEGRELSEVAWEAQRLWADRAVFLRAERELTVLPTAEVVPVVDPFVACEEDRPVPVKTRFRKPLTLLDPDADMLSSFEP